jgi:hypothetical protein
MDTQRVKSVLVASESPYLIVQEFSFFSCPEVPVVPGRGGGEGMLVTTDGEGGPRA